MKIINRKSQNISIYYCKYKLVETVPCVGNLNVHFKYITVPRKFYMTMDEYREKEPRRKYYKNKNKSIY